MIVNIDINNADIAKIRSSSKISFKTKDFFFSFHIFPFHQIMPIIIIPGQKFLCVISVLLTYDRLEKSQMFQGGVDL